MNHSQSILLIDDDPNVGEMVAEVARGLEIQCVVTSDPTAFTLAYNPGFTLILLDLMMPNIDGIELLRLLEKRRCKAGIVLMSGVNMRILESAESLALSLGLSIAGHLRKPFRIAELEQILTSTAALPNSSTAVDIPRLQLEESDIHRAFAREEFVIHYQPQIEIASGNVVGVEALIRWLHPSHGLIPPDSFIPVIEKMGRIDQLGWLVTNVGLNETRAFQRSDGAPLNLSVNFSVFSLMDLRFPDSVMEMVQKHGAQPDILTIELTETGLIRELPHSLDVLTRLRMKGIQLSIDDFGTGYSVMQQLTKIPANEIKIDRSFIRNLHRNTGDRIMAQKTIEIGHDLDMRVVAEGVETEEQLTFLSDHACDVAQGYLLGRPMASQELSDWFTVRPSPNSKNWDNGVA